MLKFGLLLVLCNLCLKVLIGIGLWKMAMEYKNSDEPLKVSDKYNEEIIGEILPGEELTYTLDFDYQEEKTIYTIKKYIKENSIIKKYIPNSKKNKIKKTLYILFPFLPS